jgi:hypothetical protein
MDSDWKLAGLVLLSLLVFYAILSLQVPGLWKFGLSVAEMALSGRR